MASRKKNETSTYCTTPTPTSTTDSKLAASTEKLEIQDKDGDKEHLDTDVANLDSVLNGGCSTCGSKDHDEVDCEDDPDPMYMMSTALPPSTPKSSSSSMSTGKGGRGGQGGGKKSCCK